MNKKIALTFIGLLYATSIFGADNIPNKKFRVFLEGERVKSVSTIAIEDTTYVPVRGFFEHMGASISWDPVMEQITVKKDETIIQLKKDSKQVSVNGEELLLDQPVKFINGTSNIPLRFVSEALGYCVDWEDSSKSVHLHEKFSVDMFDSLEEVIGLHKISDNKYIIGGFNLKDYSIEWLEDLNAIKLQLNEGEQVLKPEDIESLLGEFVLGIEEYVEVEENKADNDLKEGIDEKASKEEEATKVDERALELEEVNLSKGLVIKLKENVLVQPCATEVGLGLFLEDKPEEIKYTIPEGITCLIEGHPVIRINKTENMQASDIAIVDNYRGKQIVIELNSDQSFIIPEGEMKPTGGPISKITTTHKNGKTQIIIDEKNVYAVEMVERENEIEFHIRKPREVYSKVLVIDIGHGGKDGGSSGNGLQEKTLNFKQAMEVKDLLVEHTDIKVYVTREDDATLKLSDRTTLSNDINPHIFISFHNNSTSNSKVSGTEVLYNPNSGVSKKAAQVLLDQIVEASGFVNRGLKPRKDLYVLNKTNTPAILLEIGFLSNPQNAAMLKDESFNRRVTRAIATGIVEIFEEIF